MSYDSEGVAQISPVERLGQRLNTSWESVGLARQKTHELLERLSSLSDLASEDASIVVFGSIGRGEVTDASDVDWTLLIDGPADPDHAHLVSKVRDRLESLHFAKPGTTETFGVLAFSHELVHHIAGVHDTNKR